MDLERVNHEWIPNNQATFAFRGGLVRKKTKKGPKRRSLGTQTFGLLHVETALAGYAVSNGPIVASRLR